jgi:hypothetical protein
MKIGLILGRKRRLKSPQFLNLATEDEDDIGLSEAEVDVPRTGGWARCYRAIFRADFSGKFFLTLKFLLSTIRVPRKRAAKKIALTFALGTRAIFFARPWHPAKTY